MADKDQNEEYEFSDVDIMNPENAAPDYEASQTEGSDEYKPTETSNVLRNALIAVGVFILAVLLYRFVSPWYGAEKAEKAAIPTVKMTDAATQAPPEPSPPAIERPAQVSEVPPTPDASVSQETSRKLSALEISQQSLRSDVSTLTSQISSINSNITELSEQMNKLSQMINQLSGQLEQQSREITRLRFIKVKKTRAAVTKPTRPALKYNIQAIIPGRAWLIASNGTTITIREGSTVAGYGVVKLIDPIQGKVLTSSGKIIRFSPQDS